MDSIDQSKQMIRKAIKDIESKMNDPAFLENLTNNGHNISSNFLDLVKMHLNLIEMQVGRKSPVYVELSEAIALIGSGCLRWATGKTRKLFSASDFRKNSPLYYSEKVKVEKCYELIRIYSNMEMQDPAIKTVVREVNDIVETLHSQFQKKSGCYIATVVYNDPYCVEVLTFKNYRDNVLYKIYFGQILMSLYYYFSPKISELLVKRKNINRIIKIFFLNPFYKKIARSQNLK